ncbi:MAG: hypothetical protein ACI4MB_04350 [Candidatus Coproplasma sp.]
MRIYFLSCRTAALKLNGEYLGTVGAVEKYVDWTGSEDILAEIIPNGEWLPRSFFIGQELFKNPPAFLKVYLFDGGAQICVAHFERLGGLKILEQRSISGLSTTYFSLCGRAYLSCDGQESSLYELPDYFLNCRLTAEKINGLLVLILSGKDCLCVISSSGKKLHIGRAESYSTGDMLELTINFKGCAGYYAEQTYGYNGQELTKIKSEIKRRYEVESSVLPFAFFECLLYGGDCGEYLTDELQTEQQALKKYLGAYTEVTVPHKAFFDIHGDIPAAALAYPIKENLFEIKYFSVEIKGGKIDNIDKASP